jgi:hypothetical protein
MNSISKDTYNGIIKHILQLQVESQKNALKHIK